MTDFQRVVLDANVLVSARKRHLLLEIAERKLYLPRWSEGILGEVRKALSEDTRLSEEAIDPIIHKMENFFPEAKIHSYESLTQKLLLENPNAPDKNDLHVIAAARHDGCDGIVTNDEKGFPASILEPNGLQKIKADDFLCHQMDRNLWKVVRSVVEVVNFLKEPPVTLEEYLVNLHDDGLEKFVACLEERREILIFAQQLAQQCKEKDVRFNEEILEEEFTLFSLMRDDTP